MPFLLIASALAGSICNDGTYSDSEGRGTCSYHGGVASSSSYTQPYQAPVVKESSKWTFSIVVTNDNRIMSTTSLAVIAGSEKQSVLGYRCDTEGYEDMYFFVYDGQVFPKNSDVVVTGRTVMMSGTTAKRLEGRAQLERGPSLKNDIRFNLWVTLTKSDRQLLMESSSLIFNDGEKSHTISLVGSSAAISRARINGKCSDKIVERPVTINRYGGVVNPPSVCSDIMNMVNVNIPETTIVKSITNGHFGKIVSNDVRCLTNEGAPVMIIETAEAYTEKE